MIWFSADTHYNDERIIGYTRRPFKSVKEMNETMIENWNGKVAERDLVYHLGDFCYGNPEPILKALNGFKILIIGSHDRDAKRSSQFIKKENMLEIFELNQSITLCHYCMRVWPKSHYNSYMLYGHSHGFLNPQGKSMDVGVDCNNFTPVSFLEVMSIMEKKPDNFNLVKRLRTPVPVSEDDEDPEYETAAEENANG